MPDRLHGEQDTAPREALPAPAEQVAAALETLLGRQLAAYAVGLERREPDGPSQPEHPRGPLIASLRLATAYEAATALNEAFGPVTVRSWFFGCNRIHGRAPAAILRKATEPGDLELLMPAVRAFIYGDPS